VALFLLVGLVYFFRLEHLDRAVPVAGRLGIRRGLLAGRRGGGGQAHVLPPLDLDKQPERLGLGDDELVRPLQGLRRHAHLLENVARDLRLRKGRVVVLLQELPADPRLQQGLPHRFNFVALFGRGDHSAAELGQADHLRIGCTLG
jgi:hypothetical protein